jgi:hypothetical protein
MQEEQEANLIIETVGGSMCGTLLHKFLDQYECDAFKVALTEHHAMKAYWRSGGIALLIL